MSADYLEYNKDGIYFAYPNSWVVEEVPYKEDSYAIVVTSPDASFWSVSVFPAGTDPNAAAVDVLEALAGEYKGLETSPVRKFVGERILVGYEMNFFYLDLTSTATVLAFEEEDHTYVLFTQTCDRMAVTDENLSAEDVFEAMTYTLLERLS
ncbi:MAG: hypothetical protein Q4G68_06745 [Planctomycetia bacterium]|nr:hypothetical protein [Planctomycetia bacterium]